MCRLFALRANDVTKIYESLVRAPSSLLHQSVCDRRGQCHDNGWGIGWYEGRQPVRERGAASARDDPRYRAVAEAVRAETALGHIRKASVGSVSEANTHPFAHGSWLFAHNGTLEGFADHPDRLRRLIPPDLTHCIEGDTDSEHLFYYLLGRLGPLEDRDVIADSVRDVVHDAVRTLGDLFPGSQAAPSQFNLVLTDGRTMIATRWGHTLFWLQRHGAATPDGPADASTGYRAIAIASEPTTTDEAWVEVPERSILLVRPDLSHAITPIATRVR